MAAGQFVWFDLMTKDPAGAEAFYKKTFGWQTEAMDAREGIPKYTIWKSPEERFGGVMELPEESAKAGSPSHWLAYVSSDDIDASLKKVASLGGTVHMGKTPIPDVGEFAVIGDPQGATIALMRDTRATPSGVPKILSWTELATSDPEGAFDFYSKLFGWHKTDAMDMGDGRTYQMFGLGGKSIGGMLPKNPQMPVSAWGYYFHVDDAAKKTEACKAAGCHVLYGPMDVPGGDIASMVVDPQGAAIGFTSPKP